VSERFEHYKHRADDAEPEIGYHSVIFDSVMPDGVLRDLMAPVEPSDIDRDGGSCSAGYYSSQMYGYELLKKVREWEKVYGTPLRAEQEARAAAESKARFEAYCRSLDLKAEDGSIPAILTRRGKSTLHGYTYMGDDGEWHETPPATEQSETTDKHR